MKHQAVMVSYFCNNARPSSSPSRLVCVTMSTVSCHFHALLTAEIKISMVGHQVMSKCNHKRAFVAALS